MCILLCIYLLGILMCALNTLRDMFLLQVFRLEGKISSKHQSQFQSHHSLPSENPLHFSVGNKRAPMWRGVDIASQVINDHNEEKKLE